MKFIILRKCLSAVGAVALTCCAGAQAITITINSPAAGAIAHETLTVNARFSSTYEIRSFTGAVEGRTVELTPSTSASLALAGLTWGQHTLTVTAIDVFGNSNQVQRVFTYDLPPAGLAIASPVDGSVIRSSLFLSASVLDDSPTLPTLKVVPAVNYGDLNNNSPLVVGSGSVTSTVAVGDGGILSLLFFASDSAQQFTGSFRVVYSEFSTNLVEVARVSHGEIQDVQPDRILFLSVENSQLPPGSYDGRTHFSLQIKSRLDGTESSVYDNIGANAGSPFLSPQGAVLVSGYSPGGSGSGSGIYQLQNGTWIQDVSLGTLSPGMAVKGNFAAWSSADDLLYNSAVGLVDLVTHKSVVITNGGNTDFLCDFAENGDVVFVPRNRSYYPYYANSVFRYRAGTTTLLSSDPAATISVVKTDGSNVCYIKTTSTNQVLMLFRGNSEKQIAEGTALGSDLQVNGDWIAYTREGGSGTMQVWRYSPNQTNTQLTFFGTASSVAALAPNGEVAFYNNFHLYISKGTWPPADVAASPGMLYYSIPSLIPFWQTDRWYARLGGSLFQIYTGSPVIASLTVKSNTARLEIMGAVGQSLVTQHSTNLTQWNDIATNNIADEANLVVADPVQPSASFGFYRLKTR